MLLPIKLMLDHARSRGYGLLRAVVTNSEEVEAVLTAAEEMNSPIVFGVNEPELEFPRHLYFESLLVGAAMKSKAPVGLQFDHTSNMDLILRAVRGGYNGIMIDASHNPFAENVALTKRVVEICRPLGILVEGEVGIITRTWDNDAERKEHRLTDAVSAGEYVEQSNVDVLAISIGEVSGFHSGDLDFVRLKEIKSRVANRAHLCLHGVSFISDEDIRACITGGITYFGCATEFRDAFWQKVDEVRKIEGAKMVDPTIIFRPAREAMKEKVAEKIRLLGSQHKSGAVLSAYFSGGNRE